MFKQVLQKDAFKRIFNFFKDRHCWKMQEILCFDVMWVEIPLTAAGDPLDQVANILTQMLTGFSPWTSNCINVTLLPFKYVSKCFIHASSQPFGIPRINYFTLSQQKRRIGKVFNMMDCPLWASCKVLIAVFIAYWNENQWRPGRVEINKKSYSTLKKNGLWECKVWSQWSQMCKHTRTAR